MALVVVNVRHPHAVFSFIIALSLKKKTVLILKTVVVAMFLLARKSLRYLTRICR